MDESYALFNFRCSSLPPPVFSNLLALSNCYEEVLQDCAVLRQDVADRLQLMRGDVRRITALCDVNFANIVADSDETDAAGVVAMNVQAMIASIIVLLCCVLRNLSI